MKVILTIIEGPEKGRTFEFEQPDVFLVGRSREAHLRLSEKDPYISRRQFLLEISPPNCILTNLSSKSATRINGAPVTISELKNGDIIGAGRTRFRVDIFDSETTKPMVCRICGREMELMADEPETDICAACRFARFQKTQIDRNAVVEVRCRCGRDLTRLANSDGLAAAFKGAVHYVCEMCVPYRGAEAGRSIGEYRIVQLLGMGGMGKVFMVYHPPTARLLALKLITNLDREILVKRFQREVYLLKTLRHPNLVLYIDSSLEERLPHLIMSYASGGNLSTQLATEGPLPVHRAVTYICQALDGLAYIHKKGIVHRDIKPENILLDKQNGTVTAKISDFGIAKRFSDAGGTLLTKSTSIMGSPFFMAPEQVVNFRKVRETGDIFSMAVTLYYLLTRKVPYDFPSPLEIRDYMIDHGMEGDDYRDVMRAMGFSGNMLMTLVMQHPIPIRERKPDLPVELANAIDKALEKDPRKRFQTAEAFRDRLAPFTAHPER